MDRPIIYRTLMEYYMGEDADFFEELGFRDNPLKYYLYTVTILHDTVLQISRYSHRPQVTTQRTALYLRCFEHKTVVQRDKMAREAITRFGKCYELSDPQSVTQPS